MTTTTAAATVSVDLHIDNLYPDGSVITEAMATVPAPDGYDETALGEWAADHLFEYTGTGRYDGDSGYVITITAASDEQLVGKTFELI